jgi:hypothetical protein
MGIEEKASMRMGLSATGNKVLCYGGLHLCRERDYRFIGGVPLLVMGGFNPPFGVGCCLGRVAIDLARRYRSTYFTIYGEVGYR